MVIGCTFPQLCFRKTLSPFSLWFPFMILLLFSSFRGKSASLVQKVVLSSLDKM